MAEKAAHITSTTLRKPSVFELIAQDSFANTFYPALKQLSVVLATKNPTRYASLLKWYEEWYLLFNLLVQNHYLKTHSSTLAEHFYGLQRVATKNILKDDRINILPFKHRMISLLFVVIFPYIRSKMQSIAEKDGEQSKQESWKKTLVKFHKLLHFTFESFSLIYYLSYLTGKSSTHSVFLRLARVILVYKTESSIEEKCWKSVWQDMKNGKIGKIACGVNAVENIFFRGLELSAFFIQFLNWWHAEQSDLKLSGYPIPLAPKTGKRKMDVCPLCGNKFKIPTALPISGYVFCFKCICNSLSQDQRCPVTGFPATVDDLVRLYYC